MNKKIILWCPKDKDGLWFKWAEKSYAKVKAEINANLEDFEKEGVSIVQVEVKEKK